MIINVGYSLTVLRLGYAYHSMAIIHGAAVTLPECLEFVSDKYPQTVITSRSLSNTSAMEKMNIVQYTEKVTENYKYGITNIGPMDQISLVGTVSEESGGYFAEFLDILEQNIFINKVISSIDFQCWLQETVKRCFTKQLTG